MLWSRYGPAYVTLVASLWIVAGISFGDSAT